MKKRLESLLEHAITSLKNDSILPQGITVKIGVEQARDTSHGDFATNLALMLAKPAKNNPRQLAEKIVAALPSDPDVEKIEIAGPGFINFFIRATAQHDIVKTVHKLGSGFGQSTTGKGRKIQVEFVSANPTGPLHVGHGRGAAYGSTVANLLAATGFEVHREYYVNDAGRQMDILTTSLWLRYLEESGEAMQFPSNGYRGEYIREIASELHKKYGNDFHYAANLVMENIPADEPQGGDKEIHIDALVEKAKTLLAKNYRIIAKAGINTILADIKGDLAEFGIQYEEWFSEQALVDSGAVKAALERLRSEGYLYEKEGATWFSSSQLGDEKDRVVVRENGQMTYFASDIAYHMNKLDRGYDEIIDIWGADHHGYVPRVKAAMQSLGADPNRLSVLLVQFAVLYRGKEKVQMSTRSGEFVTLRQLRNEVGKDAARFFYVMRKAEQHMDFDLKLATSHSNDNPVYYVQYAHARICSVFRQLDEKNWARDLAGGMNQLHLLTESHEISLVNSLIRYPEIVERAAHQREPHQLVHYLREIATHFHTYYNAHQFLIDDSQLRNARLNLIEAVRQIITNGLEILGVSAPESM